MVAGREFTLLRFATNALDCVVRPIPTYHDSHYYKNACAEWAGYCDRICCCTQVHPLTTELRMHRNVMHGESEITGHSSTAWPTNPLSSNAGWDLVQAFNTHTVPMKKITLGTNMCLTEETTHDMEFQYLPNCNRQNLGPGEFKILIWWLTRSRRTNSVLGYDDRDTIQRLDVSNNPMTSNRGKTSGMLLG